jgi:enoyl-[acyl-carrier protein] reductase II
MLRTRLCDILGIDLPIIQAPMVQAATARLVVAASNAGALGSLSTVLMPAEQLRGEIDQVQERTERPFAVNHILSQFDPAAWDVTMEARPPVVSFAMGDPGDMVAQAHAAGCLVMQQVVTVNSARRAVERGVDVIIAQGSEAGGNSGLIGTMTLVPQVVDVAGASPVVASGGIAEGRGLAAALMLGAAGVNIGTCLLASQESTAPEGWKQAIIAADSSDVGKFPAWNQAMPPATGDYFTIPNVIRTPFIADITDRDARGAFDPTELRGQVIAAVREQRLHELVPMAGQTAGLVHDILPAAEILERMAAEAEAILSRAGQFVAR